MTFLLPELAVTEARTLRPHADAMVDELVTQPPDSHVNKTVGTYYMEAVRAYAARLAELPDEAAESDFTAPRFRGHSLVQALNYLTPIAGSVKSHPG